MLTTLTIILGIANILRAQNLISDSSRGHIEWGWRLEAPPGVNTFSTAHYYLRLPQDQHQQIQVQNPQDRTQQELFLIQPQPFHSPQQNPYIPLIGPNIGNQYGIPNYYPNRNSLNTPDYYVVNHPFKINNKNSKNLNREIKTEQVKDDSIIQVFKDANCTDDSAMKHPKNYNNKDFNGDYGAKTKALAYVNFKINAGNERNNARSEKMYINEAATKLNQQRALEDDGISKLVASTQDLISNEDLLTINHAFEKSYVHNDDIIKTKGSKPESSVRYEYLERPNQQFTVKTKIENIVNSPVEHLEVNQPKEEVLESNTNQFTFAKPIVVQDSALTDLREQIANNVVSTVTPYLDEGYEITDVRNTLDEQLGKLMNYDNSGEIDLVKRPLGPRYLAPITVGLRLLNDNNTDVFNSLEDHEGSDSEFVADTVKQPEENEQDNSKEKTTVEIQESIPISITHINDVEVHNEYLDETIDREKAENLEATKSLYNKYVQALESSRKIQENMNKNLYEHGTMHNYQDSSKETETNNEAYDSEEHLESSANIQTEVEIRPDEDHDNNDRREYIRLNPNALGFGKKVIQPIVIEKEVPVTKFVDRIIEKKIPEKVEVVKEVNNPYVLPVPVEKYVDRPYEVTKYIDKPYPVPQPYPVEIRVPYPYEQKVYVDRPVHVPYPVETVVEKQVHVAVPTAVPYPVPVEQKVLYPVPVEKHIPVPYEVEKPVPYETIVEKPVPVPYPVEKRVPYPVHYETKVPVPYAVEKRVEVPVQKIVEKPVPYPQYVEVEKEVRVEVPVPKPYPVAVRYPQPYPVDRVVEKKVPYPVPVDRYIEKKVPVKVPYPVETVVEKIVEKPVLVTKYIDKPYPVEKRVPYPVEKIVEKQVPYPVRVPVPVKVPYPVETIVEKEVPIPYRVYSSPTYSASQNVPQYSAQQHKAGIPPPHLQKPNPNQIYAERYQNFLKNRDLENRQIQSTHWGKQNNERQGEREEEFKKSPLFIKYLNYLTNAHKMQYHGPPPNESSEDEWGKNSREETRHRRTDRSPKYMKLRIEYGGFKPPLIPSTEVDLDGIPVNSKEQT